MPCLMIFFFCFNYWSPVVIHLFFSEVCSCLSSLFGKTFPCWWIFILSGGGSQKVGSLWEWIHFPMGFAWSPILWIHMSCFPLVSHRHSLTRPSSIVRLCVSHQQELRLISLQDFLFISCPLLVYFLPCFFMTFCSDLASFPQSK